MTTSVLVRLLEKMHMKINSDLIRYALENKLLDKQTSLRLVYLTVTANNPWPMISSQRR